MKKVRWVSATAGAALVAAMFALPGAGVAYASDNGNTTGNGNVSVLSGNTITAPISVPVNLCGVSLAVVGFSNSGLSGRVQLGHFRGGRRQPQRQHDRQRQRLARFGQHDHRAGQRAGPPPVTSTSRSLGQHGHRAVSVPVNLCGNAVAAAGFANANCKGGSTSCIGSHCNHPDCQGQCHDCHGPACHDCHGPSATAATARRAIRATARSATTATARSATPATATLRLPRQRLQSAGLHGQLRRHPAGLHGQLRRHPARHRPRHHDHGEHRDLA